MFGLAKMFRSSSNFAGDIPIPESISSISSFDGYFFKILRVIVPFYVNFIELLNRFNKIYLILYSSP